MKRFYMILCGLLALLLLVFGAISLFDRDADWSEIQQRELKTFPQWSVSEFLSGSFMENLQAYYAETFPGRDSLLDADGIVSTFFDFGGLTLETE